MDESKNVYCSYLLRIWVEPGDGDQWRFSLEDTRTGKRQGFANLLNMVTYLNNLMINEEKNGEKKTKSPTKDGI